MKARATATLAMGAAATLLAAGCGGSDDSRGSSNTGAGSGSTGSGSQTGGAGTTAKGNPKGRPGAVPKGPIAKGERNLRPTRRCRKVGFSQGGQFIRGKAAPTPRVRASVEGETIVVRYRFRAFPARCRPKGLSVSANSLPKPEAASTPKAGESGLVKARRGGTVRLPLPKGGEAPYQVQLSSLTRKNIASDTTTIPVQ